MTIRPAAKTTLDGGEHRRPGGRAGPREHPDAADSTAPTSSKVNLEATEALGLKYVTRFSAAMLEQLLEALPAEQSPELWDRTQVMDIVREGKRYVIVGGPWRRQRDHERRQARLTKAEAELKRIAAVKRKKVDGQKLVSQVSRALQRLKAHKYFEYSADPQGKLQWSSQAELIQAETARDGLYLLGTNTTTQEVPAPGVLAHYKNLLEVEDAFCHLKSYLEVRPIFHRRPDRVRNHTRLCFIVLSGEAVGGFYRQRLATILRDGGGRFAGLGPAIVPPPKPPEGPLARLLPEAPPTPEVRAFAAALLKARGVNLVEASTGL
jgi:hypothetical protein